MSGDLLSRREIEVLFGLAGGWPLKKIAKVMNISYGTVKNHTQRIYDKLNVKNQTEAVITALRIGYLRELF